MEGGSWSYCVWIESLGVSLLPAGQLITHPCLAFLLSVLILYEATVDMFMDDVQRRLVNGANAAHRYVVSTFTLDSDGRTDGRPGYTNEQRYGGTGAQRYGGKDGSSLLPYCFHD